MTSYALMRASRLSLDSFAARAGMHPELVRRYVALVRRYVALGRLEPTRDAAGRLCFAAPQLQAAARIQRLRAGLSVNYAALGLVMDLLERIEMLEAAVRATGRRLPSNTVRSPSSVIPYEE